MIAATIRRAEGDPMPPWVPRIVPGASYGLGYEPTTPESPSDRIRLWKCRRHGNHRPVSTAPWKSRTDREISTFPQADSCWYSERKNGTKDAVTRDR